MYFDSFSQPWWPYVFFLLAGVLPTAIWRWLGVVLVGSIRDDSQWLVFIRCVANALVAAVIAQFVFQPTGALADFPLVLRLVAAGSGFVAFFLLGRRLVVGILVAEAVLLGGMLALSGVS